SACGEPMLDTVTAATPTAPAPTPPALDDAPPLPLPETGMHRSIIERAYLQTLADEGITISDERALALADQVCDETAADGGGLMDAIRIVTTSSTLPDGDAAFLAGAAFGTCMAKSGGWTP